MRGNPAATTYRGHPTDLLTPTSRIRAFLSFTLCLYIIHTHTHTRRTFYSQFSFSFPPQNNKIDHLCKCLTWSAFEGFVKS
jgi:hypothetical protein